MGGQGMGGGRGGMGGGRGGHGGHGRPNLGDAPDTNAMLAHRDSLIGKIGFAKFVLMNSMQLALADSQVTTIQRLDSLFHSVADTTWQRLDSIHAENALVVDQMRQAPRDTLPTAERDSIIARRKMLGQLMANMRTIQQDTKDKTLGVLSPDQQTKIQAILNGIPEKGGPARGGGRHIPGGA